MQAFSKSFPLVLHAFCYINDLSRKVVISVGNIKAVDNTIYGWAFENRNNRGFAAGLPFDLSTHCSIEERLAPNF